MKKLVRDEIPEILIKNKVAHKTEILVDDQQYLSALYKKLVEEVDEFIQASNNGQDDQRTKEEFADVLEVIDALCQLKN